MLGRPDLSFKGQREALGQAAQAAPTGDIYGQAMQSAQNLLQNAANIGYKNRPIDITGISKEALEALWNDRNSGIQNEIDKTNEQRDRLLSLQNESGLPSVVNEGDFSMDAYLKATRSSESGGNDSAKNPLSTATGRYQFIESTWNGLMQKYPGLGLTASGRLNGDQQEIAMRQFTSDNLRSLKNNNIPITNGSAYAAHFLGAGGAIKVLSSNNNMTIDSILGNSVIKANPFLKGMTVGEFRNWAAKKGGGA